MNFAHHTPESIAARLARVRERIEQAARDAGRDPDHIELVAVSKKQPLDALAQAHDAGQRHFGENYLQDALPKIDALDGRRLVWHFIGDIQSNKTRDIAAHFDWVHAIDRFKIARRLSEQRGPDAPALNCCIQVNLDDAETKSGVTPSAVAELAADVAALDHIKLRGLMSLPEPASTIADQRKPFARLAAIRDELNADGFELDTLSMGMSGDLEAAIAEGATCVRVGTDIFGPRGS